MKQRIKQLTVKQLQQIISISFKIAAEMNDTADVPAKVAELTKRMVGIAYNIPFEQMEAMPENEFNILYSEFDMFMNAYSEPDNKPVETFTVNGRRYVVNYDDRFLTASQSRKIKLLGEDFNKPENMHIGLACLVTPVDFLGNPEPMSVDQISEDMLCLSSTVATKVFQFRKMQHLN